jgi:hypothetical protein
MVMMFTPGGRAATSEITIWPSGLRNHSMCESPVCIPSAVSARAFSGRNSSACAGSGSRGSSTQYCIQAFSTTCSGPGR